MPVKCPNVLHRDGIGKHRTVAVKFKLITEGEDRERDRPAQTDAYNQQPKGMSVEVGRKYGHVTCLARGTTALVQIKASAPFIAMSPVAEGGLDGP